MTVHERNGQIYFDPRDPGLPGNKVLLPSALPQAIGPCGEATLDLLCQNRFAYYSRDQSLFVNYYTIKII